MFSFFKKRKVETKNIINKEEKIVTEDDLPSVLNKILESNTDITNEININLDKDKKTILFIDDLVPMNIIYEKYIEKIKDTHNIDLESYFNIIKFYENKAGIKALKTIKDYYIDISFLDITLGYLYKYENEYYEISGIDVGIMQYLKNNNSEIYFLTAHSLNTDNYFINKYIEKFKFYTGLNLNNHIISKADRAGLIIFDKISKYIR